MGDVAVLDRLGDHPGHLLAAVGEVVAVPAAVEHALGVVHLAVAQQVDGGGLAHRVSSGSGGGPRGCGKGVEDRLDSPVVVGAGQEPRLVRRGREVDPAVEHGMEERGVRREVLAAGAGEVGDRGVGEEHREHRPGRLDDVGDAGGGERVGDAGLDRVTGAVQVGVDLVGGQPQRGQPGGGRDRVPRQGARLVDGTQRRQVRHHVGPAAEGRGREAAAHHLAEGHQVRAPALGLAVEAPVALAAGPEAGHHLVGDEQRAVPGAGLGEEPVEAGRRRHHAHVAGRGLGDQAGDPVAVLGERRLDGGPVVVGQHQGERGRRGRYAGGAGRGRVRRGRRRTSPAPSRRWPAARRRGRGSNRRTSPRRRGR